MRRRRHSFQALTATGFLALALTRALVAPTAAQAHGDTVKVVITGQRDGHLTTEVTWENDGDAVDEAVAATVNATSADGSRTAGPWRLVRDAGGGGGAGWSTAEVLPPGAWKVSVDVGFPALGHAEKEIAVPVVDPQPSAAAPSPALPGAVLGGSRAVLAGSRAVLRRLRPGRARCRRGGRGVRRREWLVVDDGRGGGHRPRRDRRRSVAAARP